MQTEIVWIGRDNSIDLILKADGTAIALAAATRITAGFGATLIDSDNGDTDPIRWAKVGYETGEIRLFLGALETPLTAGVYKVPITVYEPANPHGIFWGHVDIRVLTP